MNLRDEMTQLARQAKAASRELALLTTEEKNRCLLAMASAIEQNAAAIASANQLDMIAAAESGLSSAMLDRLKLDAKRIAAMAKALREVASLPDPVGRILDDRTRPNGLRLQKIATPMGVVVIIYESRPNVTADAASLCFKAGSATILRGGREALNSNQESARLLIAGAKAALPSFPVHAIQVVPTSDRLAIPEILSLTQYVDLCMPRGGEGLIRAVSECSKVPVIKHYKGVCHVFVDESADLGMAESISLNAKLQRPAVCNSMETLLVHSAVARVFLQKLAEKFAAKNVQIHADPASHAILQSVPSYAEGIRLVPALEQDYSVEYNDLILNIRIVPDLRCAIDHINTHGSAHSDTIVTSNNANARQFLREVDSAAVYWNASTRFTDGGEFGMGAEIGISTDKVGARGPMGLEELTTYKWQGIGSGQIRE
jgi:glutamate-5-semialdehyde dehydrogenase